MPGIPRKVYERQRAERVLATQGTIEREGWGSLDETAAPVPEAPSVQLPDAEQRAREFSPMWRRAAEAMDEVDANYRLKAADARMEAMGGGGQPQAEEEGPGVLEDMAGGLQRGTEAVVHGAVEGVDWTLQLSQDIWNTVRSLAPDTIEEYIPKAKAPDFTDKLALPIPETRAAQIVSAVAQFVAAYTAIPLGGAIQGVKAASGAAEAGLGAVMGARAPTLALGGGAGGTKAIGGTVSARPVSTTVERTAAAAAKGSAVDFAAFDPGEGQVMALLNEMPALEPFINDWISARDPSASVWEGRFKNAVEGYALGAAGGLLFEAVGRYVAGVREGSAWKAHKKELYAEIEARAGLHDARVRQEEATQVNLETPEAVARHEDEAAEDGVGSRADEEDDEWTEADQAELEAEEAADEAAEAAEAGQSPEVPAQDEVKAEVAREPTEEETARYEWFTQIVRDIAPEWGDRAGKVIGLAEEAGPVAVARLTEKLEDPSG